MRLNSFLVLASVWIALVAMAMPAAAAAPAGTAIAVRAGVTASGPQGTRTLGKGADIYLGDRVETGIFGQVEIEFTDHTKLAVGPNSSMVIDAYVMQSRSRLKQLGLTASRGAFRFLTGDSAKQAYRIKTPTATIGIRGTEFDFAVRRVRATAMALYGGLTRICSLSSGICADLRASCDVGLVDDGQVVKTRTAALTDQQIRLAFPFMGDEGRLSGAFHVGSAGCINGDHSNPLPGGAINKADIQPGQKFVEFHAEFDYFPGNTSLIYGTLGPDGEPLNPTYVSYKPIAGPLGLIIGSIVPLPPQLDGYGFDTAPGAVVKYRVLLSDEQYRKLDAFVQNARKTRKAFWLYTNNCVRFVRDAARAIGLKAPEATLVLPIVYINELSWANRGRVAD